MHQNEPAIRYAVICPDQKFRHRIRETMNSLVAEAELVAEVQTDFASLNAEALKELHNRAPQVVILDVGSDPVSSLRSLRHLSERDPGRVFVLAGPELERGLLLDAMRAGASEYLVHPVEQAEMLDGLQRSVRKVSRPASAAAGQRHAAKLLAFFGAKGGTGVTTTATNLAVQMARSSKHSVLLLDLDMELGSAAVLLGIRPRYSFLDVVRNFHRIDDDLLRSYIEVHESGLHLLAPPSRLDVSEGLTRDQLDPVLEFLSERYEYILVDLPRTLTPVTASALARADQIFLVATPEIPCLRNLKRLLPVVSRVTSARTDHYRLLLNGSRAGDDPITGEDVREVLGMGVHWTLPSEPAAVAHSVNTGKPMVLNSGSRYTREVAALSASILGDDASGAGGSIFGALAGVLRPFRRAPAEGGRDAKDGKVVKAPPPLKLEKAADA